MTAKKETTVQPKASADLANRASKTNAPANSTTATATEAVKAAAAGITAAIESDETHTKLATPAAEDAMRKEATSAKARKEALAAGKKDPLEKWGDPNVDPAEAGARRALGGF